MNNSRVLPQDRHATVQQGYYKTPARWTTRSGGFKMHCERSKSGLVYFPPTESSLVCIMDLILLANQSTTAKSSLKFARLIKLARNAWLRGKGPHQICSPWPCVQCPNGRSPPAWTRNFPNRGEQARCGPNRRKRGSQVELFVSHSFPVTLLLFLRFFSSSISSSASLFAFFYFYL